MEEYVLNWLESFSDLAIVLSVILNIIISVIGFVPSVFITAANIKFFGFEHGLIVSILGEALGAIISFILYRKGTNKVINKKDINNKLIKRLMKSEGIEAFFLIISLRIFPFVPSGIVTLAGAISKAGIINFFFASTIGKVPALVIEAYSIQQVLVWNWQGKVILGLFSLIIFVFLLRKNRR